MFGGGKARKLKDQAQAAAGKGKYKKALEAYLELENLESRDGDWSRRAGEMYRHLDQRRDAIAAFGRAVDRYAEAGFLVKAIAVCRMMLRIDPQHTHSQQRLVSLQAARGIHVPAEPAKPDTVEVEPAVARAEAPEPPPAEDESRRRTLPPGHTLGDISLADMVPGSSPVAHLPDEQAPDSGELVFEIPLDDADLIEVGGQHEALLSVTPLFSELPPTVLQSLISRVRLVELEPGQVLFHQGDPGEALYVVAEGEVCVVDEGPPRVVLSTLGEGAFFGEVALVTSNARNATVEARSRAELLEIHRDVVGQLIDEEPGVLQVMLRFLRDRLVDNLIRISPLFAPYGESERAQLSERFRFLEIDEDTVLVKQGERSNGVYILLSGHAEVVREDEQGTRRLSTLSTGDLAGEMSLLANSEAVATVRTTARSLALELPAEVFREVIMTHPQVLMYVSDVADERRRVFEQVVKGDADFKPTRLDLV